MTLYSTNHQPTSVLSYQQKTPPTELPGSNSDNNEHRYHRENFPEMRNPTVDPRKSRRHGTDFGLGRHAESSLNSDHQNSSKAISVSGPLATMQDNPAADGDSISSLFECSALDFPQPPPIGSPVIRRMRSSPWFSDKNEGFENQESRRSKRSAVVLLDSDFHGLCYSVSPSVSQQPTMRQEILRGGNRSSSNMVDETTNAKRARLHLSPYLDLGINEVSLEMVGEALVGLDMNAPNLGPQKRFLDNNTYDAPSCEFCQASGSGCQFAKSESRLNWSTQPDLLRWSTSHRSPPLTSTPLFRRACQKFGGHTFGTETKPCENQGMHSLGRLPRIIRKVASMRSDTRRPDINCIPLKPTGPRALPKSRSFRSIPLASCEAGNIAYSTMATIDGSPHRHRGWSFANPDYFSSPKDDHGPKYPFSPTLNDPLRAFEHYKGRGTQHISLPLSSLGSLGSKEPQHKSKVKALRPMALSGPFVYRETCNRSMAKTENDLPNRADKSFIDIAPNQGAKHERSETATQGARMKKLIARASNTIIEWGRQLTGKDSPVK